jgi:PhzF family phenazine biosynthesis protein
MLAIAADLGYSESAFLRPAGDGTADIRYFSPEAEVPFCGHATIATAVAWAERHGAGSLLLRTMSGEVPVTVSTADGRPVATLTSVEPAVRDADPADLEEALAALGWTREDLDPALPPRIGYAGAHHLILAARTRERLAALDYDFDRLKALMLARDWTTVDLVWREDPATFHARNPFPPGGVLEDPATGAAAAALGGLLREQGLVPLPATVTVLQGADMGRPSRLTVDVPQDPGSGIRVTGTAVPIPPLR